MEHKQAVDSGAVERYVVGELSGEELDAFEEHYFTCPECAQEVAAAWSLRAAARDELRQPAPVTASTVPVPQWLAWAASILLLVSLSYPAAVVLAGHNPIDILTGPGELTLRGVPRKVLKGPVRGTAEEIKVDPNQTETIISIYVPPGPKYPRIRVDFPHNDKVYQVPVDGGLVEPFLVFPTKLLTEGEHQLTLYGLPESGTPVEIEVYRFEVIHE